MPWSWDTSTNISAHQSELPASPLKFNPARTLLKTVLVKRSTSSLQVSSHIFLIKCTGMAHSELTIAISLNLQHIIIIFLSIYHLGTFFSSSQILHLSKGTAGWRTICGCCTKLGVRECFQFVPEVSSVSSDNWHHFPPTEPLWEFTDVWKNLSS